MVATPYNTEPHVRVTASGTLGDGAGNEIWSCGLKVVIQAGGAGPALAPTAAQIQVIANAAGIAWGNLIGGSPGGGPSGGLFSSWVHLTVVKAAAIKSDHHLDKAVGTNFVDVANIVGAATVTSDKAFQTPYQVALVATLKGATFGRGSASHGRIYLPCPNLHVDPTGGSAQDLVSGLLQPVVTSFWADNVAVLLQGINASAIGGGLTAHVANIGKSLDADGSRFQKVSTVTFDNRPDTVRRRYSALSGLGRVPSNV